MLTIILENVKYGSHLLQRFTYDTPMYEIRKWVDEMTFWGKWEVKNCIWNERED